MSSRVPGCRIAFFHLPRRVSVRSAAADGLSLVWGEEGRSSAFGAAQRALLTRVTLYRGVKGEAMWKPDGWDVGWRIGVLTPHADVGPESELRVMAPSDVGIYAARVPFGAMAAGGAMDPTIPLAPVRAFAEPPGVDDAAELLAAAPVGAIAFAFTSSAYVIGASG